MKPVYANSSSTSSMTDAHLRPMVTTSLWSANSSWTRKPCWPPSTPLSRSQALPVASKGQPLTVYSRSGLTPTKSSMSSTTNNLMPLAPFNSPPHPSRPPCRLPTTRHKLLSVSKMSSCLLPCLASSKPRMSMLKLALLPHRQPCTLATRVGCLSRRHGESLSPTT